MMPSENRSSRATRSRTLVSIASDAAMLWNRIWKGTCMIELRIQASRLVPT
jgi:hypothetical protein